MQQYVTLKDPIERGLKVINAMARAMLQQHVTLKDPIERGLKGHLNGHHVPVNQQVTLKDPIERGLKAPPFSYCFPAISSYTQRPDRKGTERQKQDAG